MPTNCHGPYKVTKETKITKNPLLLQFTFSLEKQKNTIISLTVIGDLREKVLWEVPESRDQVLGSIVPGRIGEGFLRGLWSRLSNHNEVPRKLIVCEYWRRIFALLNLYTKARCREQLYRTHRILSWEKL